ncbi:MAG: DUF6194 family protein [Elsteraceae bacterium]
MSEKIWIERETIHDYLARLAGVAPQHAWGETSYFYNPGRRLARGAYFATIKDHDGAHDQASALSRVGVWRLSLGVSQAAYVERFGPPPRRPSKGGVVDGQWDFEALDVLTPHPVYGWMAWVAVLTPSTDTWIEQCLPLITDAHKRARIKFESRSQPKLSR